jgi:hypothetical protein
MCRVRFFVCACKHARSWALHLARAYERLCLRAWLPGSSHGCVSECACVTVRAHACAQVSRSACVCAEVTKPPTRTHIRTHACTHTYTHPHTHTHKGRERERKRERERERERERKRERLSRQPDQHRAISPRAHTSSHCHPLDIA